MKLFEVNFSNHFDPYWFRLLYPQVRIHQKQTITDGQFLLSLVPYNKNYYPRCQSLFLRTSNGVNLEQPLGIHSFLKDVGYLSESKLKKFRLHFPLDSQIETSDIPLLFKKIQKLNLTIRFPKESILEESIFDFYKKPLQDRILVSSERVPFLLRTTLKFIHNFYRCRTDLRGNQVWGFQKFFNRFRIKEFEATFNLTDSEYNDFLYLQTFFK